MNIKNDWDKSSFEKILPVIILVLSLGIWEALARLGIISTLFYPPPSKIMVTWWQLLVGGKLLPNLEITLARLAIGFILGMIPGLFLGFAMGWSHNLRVIIDPFIAAFHPIPKTAIFPLFMIILGIGESSKIFTIAIATFFPVLINSMAGVRQINPVYFEVAHNYGAKSWEKLTRVILPGSLPMVLAGVRIAFNNTLMITIALELLTARKGLGVLIWYAWETLRTQELYATLITVALIGIIANHLLQKLTQAAAPWSIRKLQENSSST